MIDVQLYTPEIKKDLLLFCSRARQAGLDNNIYHRMKLDTILYYVAYYKGQIISVCGIEHRDNAWWITRIATLPEYYGLLGFRRHFGASSIIWLYLMPRCILYAESINDDPIYACSHVSNDLDRNNIAKDPGPWRTRTNKHSVTFAKLGVLKYVGTWEIKKALQDVYQFELDAYWEHINKLTDIYGLE